MSGSQVARRDEVIGYRRIRPKWSRLGWILQSRLVAVRAFDARWGRRADSPDGDLADGGSLDPKGGGGPVSPIRKRYARASREWCDLHPLPRSCDQPDPRPQRGENDDTGRRQPDQSLTQGIAETDWAVGGQDGTVFPPEKTKAKSALRLLDEGYGLVGCQVRDVVNLLRARVTEANAVVAPHGLPRGSAGRRDPQVVQDGQGFHRLTLWRFPRGHHPSTRFIEVFLSRGGSVSSEDDSSGDFVHPKPALTSTCPDGHLRDTTPSTANTWGVL